MEALMGRHRAQLSSVYGLLKKEGEYTAMSTLAAPAERKPLEKNNFVPLGMCLERNVLEQNVVSSVGSALYHLKW